uniref:ABC transporter ATP-binding protein n=1 Tax=Pseudomonas phage Nican01 TaxID=3138540 RepID=A0AAU6W0M3_9CAUD
MNQPEWEIVVERDPAAKPRFSLLDTMRVEPGTKADWDELHDLHYKAESLPAGPRYWRCVTSDGILVGIVVFSTVSLLLAPRHQVFPKLKPGQDSHFTNVHRATFLNANFRRAARIVTDTMYRGVGVSYRMVNLAMRMEQKRFIEIQSSMSKFNPFDVKAGFKHAHLKPAAAYVQGLKFMRSQFSGHPADHQAIMDELKSFTPAHKARVMTAMQEFYYRHSAREKTGSNLNVGTGKVQGMKPEHLLRELQQLVFASPVYGIWTNPDLGRPVPQSLPLRAFDLQSPTEPLRLDLL